VRMIKCQVVVHVAAAARSVFTRRKARGWCYTMGLNHVLHEKCAHPECKKARSYFQRGILYPNGYGGVYTLGIGFPPDPSQIATNKGLLKVKP
jgi:hypothetical protein